MIRNILVAALFSWAPAASADTLPPGFSFPEVSSDGLTWGDAATTVLTGNTAFVRARVADPGTGVADLSAVHVVLPETAALWRFNEAAGTSAADAGPAGNAATLLGGAAFAPGRHGNALTLAGGQSARAAATPHAARVTVSGWFRATALPDFAGGLVGRAPASGTAFSWLLVAFPSGAGWSVSWFGDPSGSAAASPQLPLNQWVHLAAVTDGSKALLYVNGTLAGSVNSTTPIADPAGSAVAIGRDARSTTFPDRFFRGQIDDLRVAARALSAAEVAADAAGLTPAAFARATQDGGASWTPAPAALSAGLPGDLRTVTAGPVPLTQFRPAGQQRIELFAHDLAGNRAALAVTLRVQQPDTEPPAFSDAQVSGDGASFLPAETTRLLGDSGFVRVRASDAGSGVVPASARHLILDETLALYRFDEGGGPSAADAGPLANAAALQGGAGWEIVGRHHAALKLAGGQWASAAAPPHAAAVTIEGWFKAAAAPDHSAGLVTRAPAASSAYSWLLTASPLGDGWAVSFFGDQSSLGTALSPKLALGAWHHLAAVADGKTMSLYVNGVLAASRPAGAIADPAGSVLAIGRDARSAVFPQRFFRGQIDDLRIVSRALSAQEILDDARGTTPAYFAWLSHDTGATWTPVARERLAFAALGKDALLTASVGLVQGVPDGTNQVAFTAYDAEGSGGSNRVVVKVRTPNLAPTAAAGEDRTASVGKEVAFDASGSVDPEGEALTYAWDFGDGTGAAGALAGHAYGALGTYTVTLTVTDPHGASAQDTAVVTVSNRAPTAAAGEDRTARRGQALTFDASASSDPDGDALAAAWDFGDGTRATGTVVTHAYAALGAFTVTLTVTDAAGAAAQDTASVAVVNQAPTARLTPAEAVLLPGQSAAFDASASSDPDGDALAFAWDLDGDGAFDDGAAATAQAAFREAGAFTVRVRVADLDGAESTASAAVTVKTHLQACGDLKQDLAARVAEKGLRTSLVKKAEGACASMEKGKLDAALGQLGALDNELQAQSGKKIPAADAAALRAGLAALTRSLTAPEEPESTLTASEGAKTAGGGAAAPEPAPGAAAGSGVSGGLTVQWLDQPFALGEVYAFPNPARGAERPTFHVEAGVADGVTVRVYDLSGRLVHEAAHAGTPQVVDDGQGPQLAFEVAWDTGGVGSGVYLFVAEARKAGSAPLKASGKVAVVK